MRESVLGEQRLLRLLDVGRSLVSELDIERLLHRVLEVAQELTSARYAALGAFEDRRERLERFITLGVDEETHRAIGDLPRGYGILGVLITDPRPLRLHDVGDHPQSYGFPPAHPPMHTFLGERILELIAKRGRALVAARVMVIELVDGPDLVIKAAAGAVEREVLGERIPV